MISLRNKMLCTVILCLAAFQSLNALDTNPYKLSGKRKPLMTRQNSLELGDYKRTKRQLTQPMQEFQDFITNSKTQCANGMGFSADELQKSLLYEDQPTRKEKCLIECILKRMEVMDKDNTLSTAAIGRIANIVGNNNPLITSIAMATADNCKKFINAEDSCERAHQINICIATEMKMRKIKLIY
ncbi:PREDICTED: general odorant-binding protein 19d isoform X1 [Rhagoletis zephyria]|uniref:general odorant-binding protein 19d isoform X1 n=2 Tax=Rhagoletis zephyria TaxID=28612 RepID=UPI0008118A16|nr:PREDICTED: general odorant-binding protein 19d isoform X1 [Rhagoletis zephyria]